MPPRRRAPVPTLGETFRAFSEGLKQSIIRPTIYGYVPHPKQLIFHSSQKKRRLYLGGNRGGKTVGGVAEDIWWLTGEHPYRTDLPKPPVRGRCVTVDFLDGLEKIILPEFTRWIPPSKLIAGSWELSYSKRNRTLTLQNGSFIEFMSYEQDIEAFAGTSRHFIHYDEEPPKAIFNECNARLIDTGGSYWITMTPLLGMASFTYKDLFIPAKQDPDGPIELIEVDMLDNPYISEVEAESFLSTLDDDERKARKKGEYVQIGGLAFKSFKPDIHIIPHEKFSLAPLEWTQYRSMDQGFNNPTSWHYHAVSPDGILVTWDELYQSELTVPRWAKLLNERDELPGRRAPDLSVGDPAIRQRGGETGNSIQAAYAGLGIPIIPGNHDQRFGVDRMNDYFHSLKWFICECCTNLIRQLQHVRWATWAHRKQQDTNNPKEQLHKHDDHATDDVRYLLATIMPEIPTVDKTAEIKKTQALSVVNRLLQPVTPQLAGSFYDLSLKASLRGGNSQTDYTMQDEYMGGEY